MKSYVFDIEANGYNELTIDKPKRVHTEATRVHLLVLRRPGSSEAKVYRNNGFENTLAEGFKELMTADAIIGHNIIGYDMPALRRLVALPDHDVESEPKMFDTLVAARLLWPDAKNHPFGGNSLEDFGRKLKCMKGEFKGPWDEWTQEMEDYCIQDTLVSDRIRKFIVPLLQKFTVPFKIETRVAMIIARQQANGVGIDIEKAESMIEFMELEKAKALDTLNEVFPPIIETMKTPEYWEVEGLRGETKKELGESLARAGKKKSLTKNATPGPLKTKEHPFNPGSTNQIAERLKEKYGWIAPTTEAGNPSVTEDDLTALEYPEAEMLMKYLMAEKRLQHLTDWVTRARQCRTPGVIHPQINSNGASTGRMTHQQPNQTACPKVQVDKEKKVKMGFAGRYGFEMRSLWKPTKPDWKMVGGDASGLELRMLGNRMAPYDGGVYAKEVVEGDVHTLNMKSGGLDTRDQSKTTMYAFLYGGGDTKVGTTIADHPSLSPAQRKKHSGKSRSKIGSDFKAKLQKTLPALGKLSSICKNAASNSGYITLLDGRHAPIRSAHSALNTLLQGDGAIVMKVALITLESKLKAKGWKWGVDFAFMLNAHDEFQLETRAEIAEEVAEMIVESIRETGRRLKTACPLGGEAKIGNNWAETH